MCQSGAHVRQASYIYTSINFLFIVELANNLNDPEGFLIQARNGTEVTSEIIGTFLDPDVVRVRSSAAQVNYKILSCNRSMESMEPLLPVSVCFIKKDPLCSYSIQPSLYKETGLHIYTPVLQSIATFIIS
jgi:hypothetical protein